ncbi:interferon lambda receptor 1 [Anolis carolinensis]|uniref:interferon lambda receptor 1 n=1 Tax=Anolis carolinensis TaxID=28377 RepID=UPI002F2B5E9A
MLPFGVFLADVLLLSFQQVVVEGFLPPPRNVNLASKDFSLFLTWLPDERYPPGVSYRVQWKSPFVIPWRDVPYCRDISETICNITCVSPDLNNRYWVQVRAQVRDGTRILSSDEERKDVDYEVEVDVAPPVLQLRQTKGILGVNVTFTYPSCAKEIFQHDLSYELKIWAKHGTEKPREFTGLTENAIDIDVMDWTSGNYCVLARAYFSKTKKWTNFSEPICTLLHDNSTSLQGAEKWGFVAFPFLILFSAGPVSLFLWYKNIMKKIETPQALDFSRFGSTKKLLEFSGSELIPVHSLTCSEKPLISGWRIRPGLQVSPSLHSMSEEDDDKEDEEEDDSPILYTKRLKAQNKERSGQNVAVVQKALGSSSGKSDFSGESRLSDGTSGDNNTSGFSENSSTDSSLGSPIAHIASTKDGQESGDIDFLFRWPLLMKEPKFSGLQFGDTKDHPELTLDEIRNNLDSINSVKDFNNCDELLIETPLLEAPCCQDDLENRNGDVDVTVLSSPKFRTYRPKLVPYISRT